MNDLKNMLKSLHFWRVWRGSFNCVNTSNGEEFKL